MKNMIIMKITMKHLKIKQTQWEEEFLQMFLIKI